MDKQQIHGAKHDLTRLESAYHYGRVVVSHAGRLGNAAGRWVVHQLREIRGEIIRAMRPPVKVRVSRNGGLIVAVRPEFGGQVVVVRPFGYGDADPLVVRYGEVEDGWTILVRRHDRSTYSGSSKNVFVGDGEGGVDFAIGYFPDKATAEEAMEEIRRVFLSGRVTGRTVVYPMVRVGLAALALVVALVAVRTWFSHRVPATGEGLASVSAADSAAPAPPPTTAGLMALFAGAKPGQGQETGVPPSLAAALGGNAGKPPAGFDLADDIYNEAMAKAKASMHEQGPPQSLAPDAGLKGFGLSGGATGAGCDPKLAFKVSP